MLAPILLDLALLFALCVGVAVAFHRLKLPPVVGFLVAGAVVGPHSLELVRHEHLVEQLAEVGVVVLLFTVGLEISLSQLARLRHAILVGGGLQIVGTTALGTVVGALTGLAWNQALFLGYLITLSSTAAVTKILGDRGELNSPHGRLSLSICIAQDLAVVPMILSIPLLAGGVAREGNVLWQTAVGFFWLLLACGVAFFVVPIVLDIVARTRSRELFVLTVVTICLGMALVTAELGMSLALGAFLIGMIVAESDYHHQAVAEVEPFRDALASLFFVSIGMLFDYRTIVDYPATVAATLAAVVGGKALIVWLAARGSGLPSWVGVRGALTLAQVGEFSFVIVQVANNEQLFGPRLEKVFLVVAVLSIAATPALSALGRYLVSRRGQGGESEGSAGPTHLEGHVIVVGFGPVGQAVARVLRALGISYQVVEMNAATVKAHKAKGEPVFLGDSTRSVVLRAAGIDRARLLVIAVNDTDAARRTAELAKRLVPHVHVLARATYLGEVPSLRKAGVDEVVPQELETSVEVMVRVLRRFLVPGDEVERQVHALRREAFGVDKAADLPSTDSTRISDYVPGLGVEILQVGRASELAGKILGEVHLRRRTACTVVAVRSGEHTTANVGPDTRLEAGDVVVVLGPIERLEEAETLFHTPVSSPEAKPMPQEQERPTGGEDGGSAS